MKKISLVVFFFCSLVCRAQAPDPDIQPDRQQFADIGNMKLESGQMIMGCSIGYRTYGKLNEAKTNTILFPTWFTGTSLDIEHFARPWEVIDTNRFFLVVVDALGNGVSSSPSNSKTQHGARFPEFTIRDMVTSQYMMLTKKMHIKRLFAVMGISMGGIQTFQWAVSYPSFAAKLIPIVGTPQPTSYDLMGYNIFRKIIEADSAFDHGKYNKNPVIPAATMMLELSVTTPDQKVRAMSRDSFATWQVRIDTSEAPDWNNTYYQLKAIIGHDIARDDDGSLKRAADRIRSEMLIIVSRQDHMVNPLPAMAFAKYLQAQLVILNSENGHEAPNFEDEVMQKNIRKMLAGLQ